ncbi:MAG: hypothetical protein IJP06_03240 [Agathobacter sp.]|nr:hypothetical protein [Agathobacter sp.]
MKKDSRRIDLLLAFVINFIFAVIYVCFIRVMHETNDDMALSLLVEGAYGARSPYLVYQNVLWGKLLVALYQFIPQIKWYIILIYMLIFASFLGLVYALIRTQGRKVGTIVSTIVLAFCGYNTYVIYQYSRVAAVVTACGMIVLFYAIEHTQDKLEKRLCILYGTVISLWGSMLRFQMFAVAVVLVGGSIALYKFWNLYKEKQEGWLKKIGTYVAVFGTVGVLSVGFYVVDRLHYSMDEEWSSFMEFNDARTELWDYGFPNYQENAELYQSLGISESDFVYYDGWNLDINDVTIDDLHVLIDAKEARTFDIKGFFEKYPSSFMAISVFVVYLIAAGFAVLLDKKNLYFALYGFVAVMIFEMYFFYAGRYGIARVDYGMWMAAFIALTYGVTGSLERFKEVAWKVVAVLVALTLVIGVAGYSRTKNTRLDYTGVFKYFFEQVTPDKDHLYVMLILSPITYYGFGFWEACELGELSNIYNVFGWESTMEVKESILDNYGISNVYLDGINNEKVYFCPGSQVEQLQNYIRENYNENAVLVYEKDVSGIAVYSVKTLDVLESE